MPLCLRQPATARTETLLREDAGMVVWWGSLVECASAFARLRREGRLTVEDEEAALAAIGALEAGWYEVQPTLSVRRQALRLLRVHGLRSADALQLAAALEWAGPSATGELVTFDERLAAAARLEGFALA